MADTKKDYKAQIKELLSHYEDGEKIFIKAWEADNWNYPVTLKEGSQNTPGLPQNWLELIDKVIGIIAREKYELDCYPNEIQIITHSQMLDAYTSIGLPVSVPHWSNGMRRLEEEKKYDESKHLAFEIVINSDPAIAYCMQSNSPLMQALVIAHASYGHNAFFKNNYLFKEHTDAATIIDDAAWLRNFILDCETKYGIDAVTEIMDLCDALRGMDFYRHMPQQDDLTGAERKAQAKARRDESYYSKPVRRPFGGDAPSASGSFDEASNDNTGENSPYANHENLLMFMADHAPHLPDWAREIMRARSRISQYFWPQMQTKVLNEGFASYTHYLILNDLHEMKLFNDGMYLEFDASHGGVLYQPEFDETRKYRAADGSIQERNIYSGINPYALGFAILDDIRRISNEPTEEDKKWFPSFAGNGKWWENIKKAAYSYKDSDGITQYLSPAVMRKFKFFSMVNDEKETHVEIAGIHNKDGFERVRWDLASQYVLLNHLPDIRTQDYHIRTDRALILRHYPKNDKKISEGDAMEVLKHIHRAWGHPVVLESVDPDGKIVNTISSPPSYNHQKSAKPAGLAEYGL
jgi:spore cortex formation protein SpoVR/YcgB (stage V sporulation)